MKKYEVNRAKRQAMGLTQKEIGERASVTGSTVARYENGATDMTEIAVRSLEWAYEEAFRALSQEEQAKVRIATNALLLMDARTYLDKVDCLQTIMTNCGFCLKNETDKMHFGIGKKE